MSEVIWHDVECGSYEGDLPVWEELAATGTGPILELGSGTGRVALHLARRGHAVTALDRSAALLAALDDRARGLPVTTVKGDARDFALNERFGLILVPMQLLQMFSARLERRELLRCVAAHLSAGGLAALAIVDELPKARDASPPLPDTREIDGWVYSSQPLETIVGMLAIRVLRLRQTVSPGGELSEETDEVQLRPLTVAKVEAEAEPFGLGSAGVRGIPPTADHVGSTVVLLGKEA